MLLQVLDLGGWPTNLLRYEQKVSK